MRPLMGGVAAALMGLPGCDTDASTRTASDAELEITARSLWSVGVEAGRADEEFGRIVDAALDAEHTVYLLDAAARTVRVFSATGAFLYAYGSEGRGPGEFAAPRTLLHDGVGTLTILDEQNGVQFFAASGESMAWERSVPLPFNASDLCVASGSVYAYALHDGRIIHEFTGEGQLRRSFGEPLPPPVMNDQRRERVAASILNATGRVACVESHGLVVVASTAVPVVRAWSLKTGELVWHDSLPGLVPLSVVPADRGVRIDEPTGGRDVVLVLRPVASDMVLLQSRRRVPATRQFQPIEEVITSVFITAATGRVVQRTEGLPLLPALRGAVAVTFNDNPFPTAGIVELTGSVLAGRRD